MGVSSLLSQNRTNLSLKCQRKERKGTEIVDVLVLITVLFSTADHSLFAFSTQMSSDLILHKRQAKLNSHFGSSLM